MNFILDSTAPVAEIPNVGVSIRNVIQSIPKFLDGSWWRERGFNHKTLPTGRATREVSAEVFYADLNLEEIAYLIETQGPIILYLDEKLNYTLGTLSQEEFESTQAYKETGYLGFLKEEEGV